MDSAIAYLLGGASPIPLIPGMVFTFGRGRQNSVYLKDALVSRQHAALSCDDRGRVILVDLNSSNKTFVNGEAIAPKAKVELGHNDQVRIGGTVFSLVWNVEAEDASEVPQPSSAGDSGRQKVSTLFRVEAGEVVEQVSGSAGGSERNLRATQRLDPITGPPAEEPPALAGQLSMQNLPQVLQFLHQNANTGILHLRNPEREGVLLFDKGNIFNAQSGDVSGEEAIYTLALLKEGSFQFSNEENKPEGDTNVKGTMMSIVFECCRRFDEAGR